MVGVPGRSRACITCRKRRVACDQKRPACGPCLRVRGVCEGYDRALVFVHNESESHRAVYRKAGFEATLASSLLVCNGPANQQQLLAHALESNWNHPLLFGWRELMRESGELQRPLHAASAAWYMAWLGRRNESPILCQSSQQIYVCGLHEVQRALRDAQTALSNETLAACIGLVVYETIECPGAGASGYLAHVRGCLSLMQRRGAKAHQEGAGHLLFTAARFLGALDALGRDERSFLARPEWMTIPWETKAKSGIDELGDCLLQAGEILRIVRAQQLQPTLNGLQRGFKLCLMADTDLTALAQNVVAGCTGTCYWEVPAEDPSIFPTAIHFATLEASNLLTLNWAIQALVLQALSELYDVADSETLWPTVSPAVEKLWPLRHMWRERAFSVCRSIEYCSQSALQGAALVRLAMWLDIMIGVMHGHADCERACTWLMAKRRDIGKKYLRVLTYMNPWANHLLPITKSDSTEAETVQVVEVVE